jgi:hypothetical protein
VPKPIRELLHRRNDLGTFLVHLTKDAPDHPARDNLLNILVHCTVEARSVMGLATTYAVEDEQLANTQRTVCFTETPLEHIWMMCEDIENRSVNMRPYGIVLTKTWARRKGVNPVFYVDITAGHDWLTNPINLMLEAAASGHAVARDGDGTWVTVPLAQAPIAKLAPFVEPMGNPAGTQREWWWEREWRHVGDIWFYWWDLVAILVPEHDHAAFGYDFGERLAAAGRAAPPRPLHRLDPTWGQERMIAALAEVAPENIGPFPT